MKKLFFTTCLFLIFLTVNSNAFYIWQDFENPSFPPAGWTLSTTSPFNWGWTLRCSGYGLGTGAIKANFADASSGYSWEITSCSFPSAVTGDSLKFDHAYTCYSSENDKLKIWYSSNNGTSWTELITLNGGASGPLTTAPPTGTPFVPTPTQWATKSYSIPVGTNKLKLTAISAYGNNLFLDNIKIGTRNNNDVGAVGFTRFQKVIAPSVNDTPKVIVRNFGNSVQSFSVTAKITPGTYTSTQSVTNLAAGSTQIITFPVWSTATQGTYTYTAYTSLAGDQYTANDTITNTYYVSSNQRCVLIEYATGTWCQWCPCAKTAILSLQTYYPQTVVIAYHGGGSSDPYINFNGNNIISLLGINAYPTGVVDRSGPAPINCSASGLFEDPVNRYINSTVSPVKVEIITQNYNSTTGLLNVTVNSTALSTLTGQYKINYVITEDNLVYNQVGNSYCSGGSGYVHKWVARNMVNNAAGDNLNSGGTWNNGQMITKSFSTTINSAWVAANCKLIIFVYKDASPFYGAEIQQSIQTGVNLTGINENGNLPLTYELSQNYPNPFNPVTNIKFSVPKNGFASFKVYDITGKLVSTYLEEYINAGIYNVDFDASNLSSGVYFYTLTTSDFTDTKKMLLIR
jgi:hypothetical protein